LRLLAAAKGGNVTAQASQAKLIDPALASQREAPFPGGREYQKASGGAAAYRALTGCDPAEAAIEDDASFDTHVLASILAVAWAGSGPAAEQAGLAADDLASLIARWFPDAHLSVELSSAPLGSALDEEAAMVRDLLLAHRSTPGDIGRWLAAMIARRAMEPNHLWEDLGLRGRMELTQLLTRHFGPIAARNTHNMRWKRFFYRALCEAEGFVMCKAPVCTSCSDFHLCFGEESGECRLAPSSRTPAPAAAPAQGPGILPIPLCTGVSHG
jgi:nitrogen fixation protein NifQ